MPTEKENNDTNEQIDSLLTPQPYIGKDQMEARVDDPDPEAIQAQEDLAEDEVLEADPEEKTYKKRYGDLRKFSQEQLSAVREELEATKTKLRETTPGRTSPKSDEELEAFAKDNPEAYELLVSIANKQNEESMGDVNDLREELEKTTAQAAQKEARIVLLQAHPDWDDIRASDDFHEWAEEQPKTIQDGIYANASDGALAARILDLYKQDKGINGKDTKEDVSGLKKAAAELIKAKGSNSEPAQPKPNFTRAQIAAMSIHEYEAKEADILAAQREGRIE